MITMRCRLSSLLLVSNVAAILAVLSFASGVNAYEGGQPHGKPVDLDPQSFPLAMKDTANPIWFLKFYAPWCGHCKRMAPVLDAAAVKLQGKMAIGKIDCTKHKGLCNEYKVRGFPTLKYSKDGEIFDYSGGRDIAALTSFAKKVSSPPIKTIKRLDEVTRFSLNEADEGIVFFGTDKKQEGSKLYEIFSAVARKKQASAHFLWLEQDPREEYDGKDTAVVQRIEHGVVEPRQWEMEEMTVEALQKWVQLENVPTLVTFGPSNFPWISRNGKPVVMTVLDMDNAEMVEATKKHMMDFILKAPQPEVEKNYYGLFDGKKWSKFLEQFHVKQEDNPQFLMIDQPKTTYWRNETYTKLLDFMMAVDNGTIPALKADKTGFGNTPIARIAEIFYDYFPYSLGPIFIVICLIVVMITPSRDDFQPKIRPDMAQSEDTDAGKDEDDDQDEPEAEPETKKDK
jgi:protein disulfide isomerase